MKSTIPFPKTRLEDYLNYKKEISSEVNLAGIRYEVFSNDQIRKRIQDTLKDKIAKIYSRYEQLLFGEDLHYFSNMRDLETFLREDLELKKYKIKQILRHEKEHLSKVYELGYIIKGFGCVLLTTNKPSKITYAIQTLVDFTQIIPYTDLLTLFSAPNKPSVIDKYHF